MSEELTLKGQNEIFTQDSKKLGSLTSMFIQNFYPCYSVNNEMAVKSEQEDSLTVLNSLVLYRICDCKIYNIEDKSAFFSEKMQQLFTMAYSIKETVCYGIVSSNGITSLVLGVAPGSDDKTINTIMRGLFPGITFERYDKGFVNERKEGSNSIEKDRYIGCVCGVPSLKINGEYQHKDLSSLMRSLNGQNYTIMVLCKPVDEDLIQNKINQAIQIQDECFAISKRTLSMQQGTADSNAHTEDHHDSSSKDVHKTHGVNVSGAIPLAATGAAIGSIIPGVGTAVGAIGGGLIGLIAGKQLNFSKSTTSGEAYSISDGYSDDVTYTISQNKSISGDVQNGFAIELMKMAESVVERLKIGRNIGMWESVITYSSDSELASKIIKGSLYREVAASISEVFPPVVFSYTDSCAGNIKKLHNQQLMIPKGFFKGACESPLCSYVTSEEICGICTIPVEETIGFEIQESKGYALNFEKTESSATLGYVCEYDRPVENMPFGLSTKDLNKHTFVCGITGSGKTNTVKKILEGSDKPFLVIEPAKKEYRNINKKATIYTLGRPEINCIKINPFYVPLGISPQQHIDLLKDLFSASFAFYGPMPYILEKCLYNIYSKKGWNLTLGFHPYLVDSKNIEEMFNEKTLKKYYKMAAHKHLFPTMQDLKDEIEYFINNEMTYEGEIKGNIEGAIKARIESLCVGAKGYMFNTNDTLDFDKLLSENSVIELEGLADDADKAFALGLLIIYVNEYRQVKKEVENSKGLTHLLVIEEAHRLLKNVSTENNEDLGNSKGKAVEHFTNMLAEMRSYGQGVIVAEQIPSKLAPDVIKNSSNKIIHRIVAKDDQEVIANTIGVRSDESIYLGNSKTGYALCHKEGMVQPVIVKIDEWTDSKQVSDSKLYSKDIDRKLFSINKSIIKNQIPNVILVWATKFLISLMYITNDQIPAEDMKVVQEIYDGLQNAYNEVEHKISLQAIPMVPGVSKEKCIMSCISEAAVGLLVSGAFSNYQLPEDEFVRLLDEITINPTSRRIRKMLKMLEGFYAKKPANKAIEIISWILSLEYASGYDISEAVQDFALNKSNSLSEAVKANLDGKRVSG